MRDKGRKRAAWLAKRKKKRERGHLRDRQEWS